VFHHVNEPRFWSSNLAYTTRGALLAGVTFGILCWILPYDAPVDRRGQVDWVGAALGCTALILFNFVWNQAPVASWSNPYQIGILAGSVVLFCLFVLWERHTPVPLMPLSIWKAPSFLPLFFAVLMAFMSFGITYWYMAAWLQLTRHWSVLEFAAGFTPFLPFGAFAAWFSSWLIPRLPAQYILCIGLVAAVSSAVLIATMPVEQSYWAQVFPAVILMSFCPDLVFTAAQIIASNAVKRYEQGAAASLVGTLLLYGTSIGLGFAGTIEMQVDQAKHSSVVGYRAALWFGCGIAILALVLNLSFVRMKKDEREGWQEEDFIEQSDAAVLATGTELHSIVR
jgi:hypothetical protein